MSELASVCLNIVRHPAIAVARYTETYDQMCDPAFTLANDDIHPVEGPAGVAAAVAHLLLDLHRPVHIRHSPTVRTGKGAALFAAHLRADYDVQLTADPVLAELEYDYGKAWTRAAYEASGTDPAGRIDRLFRPMLVDDDPAFPGGHQRLRVAVASLRAVLATAGLVNHLWVTHGLLMPFLYLGVIDDVPAAAWTMAGALSARGALPHGRADYNTGYHLRVPVPTT